MQWGNKQIKKLLIKFVGLAGYGVTNSCNGYLAMLLTKSILRSHVENEVDINTVRVLKTQLFFAKTEHKIDADFYIFDVF